MVAVCFFVVGLLGSWIDGRVLGVRELRMSDFRFWGYFYFISVRGKVDDQWQDSSFLFIS